jgi:membrane associated rhomboid family serine protease
MRYLFTIAFVLVYLFFGIEWGYTTVSPLWTHLAYMFQHAGVMHLVVNSIAFTGMFRVVEKSVNKYVLAAFIIIASFIASFIPPSVYPTPTVGASSLTYVLIGIYLTNTKLPLSKPMTLFILTVSISLAISFFKSNSNFFLHLFCLAAGFAPTSLKRCFQKHIHKPAY